VVLIIGLSNGRHKVYNLLTIKVLLTGIK